MPLRILSTRAFAVGLAVILLCTGVLLVGVGCRTVEFWEKRHFSDPLMSLEDDPGETHFCQKTTYSREGSAGGIGTGAGGGCGCY